MLNGLPAPLHGAIMALLLLINTVFWVVPVYALILLKLLTPGGTAPRRVLDRAIAWLAQRWAMCNVVLSKVLMAVDVEVNIDADLSPKGQYLVCCNHQTWNDIFMLMYAFGSRAPFFKFFLKQELIWVPLLGLAWWGLDYPFMKRHSRQDLAKNPALRGSDIETTKRACARYKGQPVMILNFLEGTRFTADKHRRQKSPYTHLLKPKAGGFAFALGAMGRNLDALLDVTIVYPGGAQGFWPFLCGRVRQVRIHVRQLRMDDEWFDGNYESDQRFRAGFQRWVADLWHEKDVRIGEMLKASGSSASPKPD
ncbi:acyltransferase [Polycyclovorans algicola]|uniref:acyltransferase n=1 Tax=Polycyclovorans algicola TaxID=616992 RepID=UPI0004A6DCB2|nr:acyltransferase [Polycyclovorans algicola]